MQRLFKRTSFVYVSDFRGERAGGRAGAVFGCAVLDILASAFQQPGRFLVPPLPSPSPPQPQPPAAANTAKIGQYFTRPARRARSRRTVVIDI